MHGSSEIVNNVVPAFLTKLWKLVENSDYDDLICWNPNGTSFHVFDQARFSREILPQYFKHSNMASFIRQLNMYGFRKVVNIEQGALKLGKDDTEFQHPYFVRGQEMLLDFIKRKVSSGKEEEVKVKPEDVSKVLNEVKQLHGKQESIDSNFAKIKKENEALWREMASLRQKSQKQQKIVNQLIQFLVSLVQPRTTTLPVKRKLPLMINDAIHSATDPKTRRLSRQFSLESSSHDNDIALPLSDTGFVRPDFEHNGPIIHDITDNRELLEIEPDDMAPLSLPEEILEVVNENPGTTNEMEPLAILKKNQSSNDSDNSISSFLGNNCENNENEASSSSLDLSVAISDSKLMNKSEVNEQLEGMQKDLDSLKDLFSGTNYHFDQNLLLSMLNLDGGLSNISDLVENESRGPSNEIIGNELVQYNPPDETTSLSGFADYDQSSLFDTLPNINDEEDEEDINSSTRNLHSKEHENMSNNRWKSKETKHVTQ